MDRDTVGRWPGAPRGSRVAIGLRMAALLLAALASLASSESDEEGWEKYAALESPVFALSADETNAGHFTVITRNAPSHTTLLNMRVSLSYDGPTPITVHVTVAGDASWNPWGLGAGADYWLSQPVEDSLYASRGSWPPRTCDQCIDGFSVVVERLSDITEGTVTVQWKVAEWAEGEGSEPRDMELEIVYDAFELMDGP